MAEMPSSEEEDARVPVEWLALHGGRLGLHADGSTAFHSANGGLPSVLARDRAIAANQTLAQAWLLQAANRRNEMGDPIVALLKAHTTDSVLETIKMRAPERMRDAPARADASATVVPPRLATPTRSRFPANHLARLTRDRLAHRAWLETWRKADSTSKQQASMAEALCDFVRNTALTMPGGPSRTIATTLADIYRVAVPNDQFGFGRTRCVWTPGAVTAELVHVTTTSPSLWHVTLTSGLPVGIERRTLDVAEAWPWLQRLHAAALSLAARVAFDVLPRYTTFEWQSTHEVRSSGLLRPPPLPVLTASIEYKDFEVEDAALLGELEGGAVPLRPWLQWHGGDDSSLDQVAAPAGGATNLT